MSPQPREESSEGGPRLATCSPDPPGVPENFDPGPRMLRHFSHRCRNTLSGIKLGLYLLKKELEGQSPSRWIELGRTCDEIEKLFDRLQRIYQSTSLTVVRSPLGQLFAERLPVWRCRYAAWGRTILVDPPEHEPSGDFDPTHLGVGLDAFVAWRAESGDSREPRLAWRVMGGHFEISWQESPVEGRNGQRRSEQSLPGSSPADCTGSMALLLLARVVADHNGELEARSDPALEVTVRWPQFRGSTRPGASTKG
jgi:hypothetical protein